MTDFIKKAQQELKYRTCSLNVLRLMAKWNMVQVELVAYSDQNPTGKNIYGVRIQRQYLKNTGSAKQTAQYLNSMLQTSEEYNLPIAY